MIIGGIDVAKNGVDPIRTYVGVIWDWSDVTLTRHSFGVATANSTFTVQCGAQEGVESMSWATKKERTTPFMAVQSCFHPGAVYETKSVSPDFCR